MLPIIPWLLKTYTAGQLEGVTKASPAKQSMRPGQTTFFLLWADEETVDLKLRAGRQPTPPVFSQAGRLILFHNRDRDGNRLNGGDQVKERSSTRLTFSHSPALPCQASQLGIL